eukprot:7652801-Pyramimonas_sp.AAC.1
MRNAFQGFQGFRVLGFLGFQGFRLLGCLGFQGFRVLGFLGFQGFRALGFLGFQGLRLLGFLGFQGLRHPNAPSPRAPDLKQPARAPRGWSYVVQLHCWPRSGARGEGALGLGFEGF